MSKPNLNHYKRMYAIRAFETKLLDSFSQGRLRGTTHTYLGQEAIAVAALSFVAEEDCVISNHRCHGHYLAYSGDSVGLLSEIGGFDSGVCQGIGGSQHLQYRNFYSNGILGGMTPVSAGMALAEKMKGTGAVAVCFMGDGTLGEGIVYESFNMASLWNIPTLYIVENNQYAQSTSIQDNLAGSIALRSRAFGIETAEITSNDIGELLHSFRAAFEYVRSQKKPFCQIVHTYRFGPHSKGDDFRDPSEIENWKENKDPLDIAKNYFGTEDIANAQAEIDADIERCFAKVFEASDDASSNTKFSIPTDRDLVPREIEKNVVPVLASDETPMVNHLNSVLHRIFSEHPESCLIGEDLLDPYGGAFKISKGLSTKFGDRVFSSPISEAGFMGVANGLALRGMRPIVEIMFGDFSTLIVDQLLNHATKFSRMYAGKAKCAPIVRLPMGGYRGYGPTHSQSIEKLFFGISGLAVIASDFIHDQNHIWNRMFQLSDPCLYVENKLLYSQRMKKSAGGRLEHFYIASSDGFFPTSSLKMTPLETSPNVVLVAYGGMLTLAMEVARTLFVEDEIVAKVVVPSQVFPLPEKDLIEALGSCRKILVLEESNLRHGWGASVGAFFAENLKERFSFRRCAANDTIIPSLRAGEESVLPDARRCIAVVREMFDGI